MATSTWVTDLSWGELLGGAFAAYLLYGIALAVYRLYFHPLTRYPGPKLAALTLWYEFYYEVVKRGRFADPDFYEELYGSPTRKRDKFEWSAKMFGEPNTLISTVEHDIHKRRRAPVAPYFSMAAIRRVDPVIRKYLDILNRRLGEYKASGQPVTLNCAFMAFTTDIITEYAFGLSWGYLEAEVFYPNWLPLVIGVSEQSLLHKQMPWLTNALRKIPLEWVMKVKPEVAAFHQLQRGIQSQIEKVMKQKQDGELTKDSKQTTIYHGLLMSDAHASEMTPEYLHGLGTTVVSAGGITTAHYLKTTKFHLLANSGFRISHGLLARLTRVAPEESFTVGGYTIPPGTPISMSSWLIPTERWLEPGAEQKKKYLVNFTKGSRICLGKDLGRVEIVYTLSSMVRRWCGDDGKGMELYRTTREDVDIAHDFFNPFARLDSKGLRVVLK
ncbi:cytochrome P450 [Sporormia fimetaria CBS 119925]|uniref:Cytochrome P450 n=1 Tax=Sporormia fimetaria CBS 119925 TaxID=1340428 RepID=A0A6A6VFP6_9PLEO|nr:cytochrome P450 [Sporormia fimetaria CBS 119925]